MMMTVFWGVAPCSLAEIDRRFRGAYCHHYQDDGGSEYLWNLGQFLPDYLVQRLRIHAYSVTNEVLLNSVKKEMQWLRCWNVS
jgi:hypothetical protein